MIALTDYQLDELYSYVHNSKRYRTKLEVSINNGLWEYATVLVWKSTVLFVYEKMFQKKLLGGALPDHIINTFRDKNVTCTSCYDFHHIKDEKIGENLHRIWQNVESNFISSFNNLLDERNRLSHVNRYEEDFNERWFKTYFEKSLTLIKYLQGLNNIQLSESIYTSITSGNSIQYISEQDINYLFSKDQFDDSIIINHLLDFVSILDYSETLKSRIKDDAINSFLDSSSFANALTNGKRLLKLANYFNETDVRRILIDIFTREGTPNQIIGSGEMEVVFLELFDKTVNIEGLEWDWRTFVNQLIESNAEKYNEVKEKLLEIYGEEETEEETTIESYTKLPLSVV